MVYNRTLKNNLHPLKALIYNTIAISIAAYYFSKLGTDNSTTYSILFIGWIIIFVIVFSLHVDYLLKAKTVEIDVPSKFIAFDKQCPIYFDKIEKITLVISPALHRKDPINISPFDEYHCAEFLINGGKRYFFTCLLSQNVEREISQIGIPVQVKKRLISFSFL